MSTWVWLKGAAFGIVVGMTIYVVVLYALEWLVTQDERRPRDDD